MLAERGMALGEFEDARPAQDIDLTVGQCTDRGDPRHIPQNGNLTEEGALTKHAESLFLNPTEDLHLALCQEIHIVTDVSFNYKKAMEIPAFEPPMDLKPGEARMQQIDVERSQEFRKCIECFLCQDVCHVVRDHEENKKSFAGPRFFIRIAELDMHPLDTLKNRKSTAQEEHGLGMCNITKCCTEVCPEHIKITDNAIIPMKERVADIKYDPVRWLGSKIRKREGIV